MKVKNALRTIAYSKVQRVEKTGQPTSEVISIFNVNKRWVSSDSRIHYVFSFHQRTKNGLRLQEKGLRVWKYKGIYSELHLRELLLGPAFDLNSFLAFVLTQWPSRGYKYDPNMPGGGGNHSSLTNFELPLGLLPESATDADEHAKLYTKLS